MSKHSFALVVTLLSRLLFAETESPVAIPKEIALSLKPKQVQNGQISLLCVKGVEPAIALNVRAGENKILLVDSPKPDEGRCGFVPVPLDKKPGDMEVTVTWEENGTPQTKSVSLAVKEGKFKENKLKVDPHITQPSDEELKRIQREREEIAAAYATGANEILWKESFKLPTTGPITSRFGNRRTFNGEVKSWHQGVDLRAGTGVPIYSANVGKVILAKHLFFAGNMVIVDHGAGIFTSYAHLSAVKTEVGKVLKRGELVGDAGATGRVTGPHLHWAMRVNGTLVDPHQGLDVINKFWAR